MQRLLRHVSFVPILLQKSFWGAERKFLEPLMRLAPRDVRDLIVSQKNDHGPSYWRYGALQRWSCLKYYFREIFGVVRFSTFANKICQNRTSALPEGRPEVSLLIGSCRNVSSAGAAPSLSVKYW